MEARQTNSNKVFLLLVFILSGLLLPNTWVAAAPTILWDKTFNGAANNRDEATDIIVDKNTPANIYVTGHATYSSKLNMATKRYADTANPPAEPWPTAYYDSTANEHQGNAIAMDNNDYIYVVGRSYQLGATWPARVVKYDSAGTKLMDKYYAKSGALGENPRDIAIDSVGIIYVVGDHDDAAYLVKCDSSCQLGGAWTVIDEYIIFGKASYRRVKTDGYDNVMVTGYTTPTSPTSYDIITLKWNNLGVKKWGPVTYNAGSNDLPCDMVLDTSSNIYIFAQYDKGVSSRLIRYNGASDTAPAPETSVISYPVGSVIGCSGGGIAVDANRNIYLTAAWSTAWKTGMLQWPDGGSVSEVWSDSYTLNLPYASAIAVDARGNVYVTGSSTNTNIDYRTFKYSPDQKQLTVQIEGTGTVKRPPATGSLINCATGSIGNCSENLNIGSSVTLKGEADNLPAETPLSVTQTTDADFSSGSFSQTGVVGSGGGASVQLQVQATGSTDGQVDAGGIFSCALKTDGSVYCWGDDSTGQLGEGSSSLQRLVPVRVLGGESGSTYLGGVSQIDTSTNNNYACALKTDGTVYCWGHNSNYQLGDGTPTQRDTPVRVRGGLSGDTYLSSISQVAAGYTHTCALKTDSTVYCWGANSSGQLGHGSTIPTPAPVRVCDVTGCATPISDVAQISVSNYHTCALKTDGTVYCWGANTSGQLGIAATDSFPHAMPSKVFAGDAGGGIYLSNISQISGGDNHTCALRTDGMVFCWGANLDGQIGDATPFTRVVPEQVCNVGGCATYLGNVSQVDAGTSHTCALKTDSTVYCWGANGFGQLGHNSTSPGSYTPVRVCDVGGCAMYLGGVSQIAAGQNHTCARKTDSNVFCWGNGGAGQVGDNTNTTPRRTPVQVHGVGNVAFFNLNIGNLATTYITSSLANEHSSLVIGSDGLARISYQDISGVKFMRCLDKSCATKNINTVDYLINSNFRYITLALDENNLGRISYHLYNNATLRGSIRFAQCLNEDCSSKVVQILDEGPGKVGEYSSMVLGSDGFARIGYSAVPIGLKFIQCLNDDCSSKANPITTVDSSALLYLDIGLKLGSDNDVRIVYFDNTSGNEKLKFVRCLNDNCSNRAATATLGTGKLWWNSFDLGLNDLANVVYYRDQGDFKSYFLRCLDIDCVTKSTPILVDSSSNFVGLDPSLVMGSDNLARISYYEYFRKSLKYFKCWNTNCDSNSIIEVDYPDVGWYSSIAVDALDSPYIAYYNGANGRLKFAYTTNLYNSSGTYTSGAIDMGANTTSWGNLSWNPASQPANTSSTIRARSSATSDFSTAPAWGNCFNIVNGGSIYDGGCATVGHRYIQYRAILSTNDTSVTPSLNDITFNATAGTTYPYLEWVTVSGSSVNCTGATCQFKINENKTIKAIFRRTPTVTSISGQNPQVTTGGKTIVINGTDFDASATVTIGGTAVSATYVSSTALNAIAPVKTVGFHDVIVTNVGILSNTCSSNACRLEYVDPPSGLSIQNAGGTTKMEYLPINGASRTLTGTGIGVFSCSIKVMSTTPACASNINGNSTSATATMPALATGTYTLRVYGDRGTDDNGIYANLPDALEYINKPGGLSVVDGELDTTTNPQSKGMKYVPANTSNVSRAINVSQGPASRFVTQTDDGTTSSGFNLAPKSFSQTEVLGTGSAASVKLTQTSLDNILIQTDNTTTTASPSAQGGWNNAGRVFNNTKQNGVTGAGASVQLSSSSSKTAIFASALTYNGNLGTTRSTIDSLCQGDTNKPASDAYNIKAFISTANNDEIRDLQTSDTDSDGVTGSYNSSSPVYWYKKSTNTYTQFANNWSDMLDGSISVSQQTGCGIGANDYSWAGATYIGNYSATEAQCNQWTSALSSIKGQLIWPLYTNTDWLGGAAAYCNTLRKLSCIFNIDEGSAYNPSGTYTSYLDAGAQASYIWKDFSWSQTANTGSVSIKVKTSSSTTAPSFASGTCNGSSSGTSGSITLIDSCRNSTDRYIWYEATLTAGSGNTTTSTLDQVQVTVGGGYNSSGTFISGAVDRGLGAVSWDNISWTKTGTGTITMRARSADNSSMTGATDWASCPDIANGTAIPKSGAGGCATDGHRYIQYQASLSTTDAQVTPSLDDVTIGYNVASADPCSVKVGSACTTSNVVYDPGANQITVTLPLQSAGIYDLTIFGQNGTTANGIYATLSPGFIYENKPSGLGINQNYFPIDDPPGTYDLEHIISGMGIDTAKADIKLINLTAGGELIVTATRSQANSLLFYYPYGSEADFRAVVYSANGTEANGIYDDSITFYYRNLPIALDTPCYLNVNGNEAVTINGANLKADFDGAKIDVDESGNGTFLETTGPPDGTQITFTTPAYASAHAEGLAKLRIYSKEGTDDNKIYIDHYIYFGNGKPQAVINIDGFNTLPSVLRVGRVYSLSHASSTDPEAGYGCTVYGIQNYTWQVIDAPVAYTGSRAAVNYTQIIDKFQFTPDAAGAYRIKLTVTDNGTPPEPGTAYFLNSGPVRTLPIWKELHP